ncbi:lanthionine synthetase C family protein [Priestia megaterium]|uniref:lanthionine synthetase C family protein n=1 Tax=Priestia megaterium TaxID=1404 RepID=UPI00234F9077|nr:lanthionine synthetase C family protein [Priestia megaterium]MDC7783997.1 lanthionine synthetase C family protein [Priestia megaterium]
MSKASLFTPIDSRYKSEILEVVLKVAHQLSNPLIVKEESCSKENEIEIDGVSYQPWSDLGLSHGYPGLCILYGELDNIFPEQGWDDIGHEFLLEIQKAIEKEGIGSTSAFNGLVGIAFAVRALSRKGTRYTKFLEKLNKFLLTGTREFLEEAIENSSSALLIDDYDVISGLSGIGRYLIHYKDLPEYQPLIHEILNYMVNLTRDKIVQGQKVPGWFIKSENLFLVSERINNPIGSFNCGLSHGIAGPLALLSIALQNGIEVEGHREAILKIGNWLINFSISSGEYKIFPGSISWEEQIEGKIKQSLINREAWCYGTPGVARVLLLAGIALNNQYFIGISLKSFKGIFERSELSWNINSPTFCHGYSGLLHIANLMNNYSKLNDLNLDVYVEDLLKKIMNCYDLRNTFGFQDIETMGNKEQYTNKAGFLSGTAGILLPLLHLCKNKNHTDWDTLFLLN